ncbi:hypothetical protein Droror1_Dr00017604, partial [Drosera rotundifolia]
QLTATMARVSYPSILVDIHTDKELIDEITFTGPRGESLKQKIWVPKAIKEEPINPVERIQMVDEEGFNLVRRSKKKDGAKQFDIALDQVGPSSGSRFAILENDSDNEGDYSQAIIDQPQNILTPLVGLTP